MSTITGSSNSIVKFFSQSRLVELGFAGGVPVTGYLLTINSASQLPNIWVMLVATGLVGWHILVINDYCFPGNTTSSLKLLLGLLFPLISFSLSLGFGYYKASLCIFLMLVNWNLYSLFLKKHFLSTLVNNFLGGYLHVSSGVLFADGEVASTLNCGVFFGLIMVGASMHHDALDYDEDKRAGYNSGAVRFGQVLWWRLGILPMTAANIVLLFKPLPFRTIFLVAFLVYLVVFMVFSRRPFRFEGFLIFRFISRAIYGCAGICFLIGRLAQLI